MNKMKVAVIGMGSIGKRHASNLMSMDQQIRTWDPASPGKLTREETIGGAEAVVICSPTRNHFQDMTDCHGKHIFVEKPMAFDAPEPLLRGYCQGKSTKGEVVAVGNNLRFHHCVRDTKKMLDSGAIGTVGWADFWVDQKTDKKPYLMDGVSRNWGAHEIDLALYLLGPATATEVTKVLLDDDDNDVEIAFSLQHASGTFSSLHMDYLTEPERRGYRLVGTKGVIEVDLVARTIKMVNDFTTSINQTKDTWDQNYLDEITEFLKCCHVGGIPKTSALASGLEGAAVMDIILSVRSMAHLKDKEDESWKK